MTKQSNKGAPAASKEAADNWDDAPAPGSQNPEPKSEPGPKPENQPAERRRCHCSEHRPV